MKKLLALLMIVPLLGGCKYFDFDGNGRFDPIAYLESADITLSWVDDNGQVYEMAVDDLGKRLVGQFIQAKTGYLFELTNTGGIVITDPEGRQIRVARKE